MKQAAEFVEDVHPNNMFFSDARAVFRSRTACLSAAPHLLDDGV